MPKPDRSYYVSSFRLIGSEHRADGVTIRTYEAIYRPDADPMIAERVAIGMAVGQQRIFSRGGSGAARHVISSASDRGRCRKSRRTAILENSRRFGVKLGWVFYS